MPRPRKLSDEEIAAAQVMWLAKVRRKIIAARFGVGVQTLRDALVRLNPAENSEAEQSPNVRKLIGKRLRDRYQALVRANGCCELCGARASADNPLEVDHIKPVSKHPDLARDRNNLQVLCHACNQGKGNSDETDWRARKQSVQNSDSSAA